MFKKILIANRGEIAVRIIQTAHALGYGTVAVFSDADADAPHVALADTAVRLGPPEVGASYLNIGRILEAAARTGADAVHPGYGFLSENAAFAQAVIDAGLVWIGPPPAALRLMGNKAAAKQLMAEHGVLCISGYAGADQSEDGLMTAAEGIGYPIMVKAAAGGGGRGMRLVGSAAELPAALASARSEAEKAFGSGELLLEKGVVRPRHVEIQIFGDQHGRVIHLGERDCSVQRRHQKVIEEAPSPAVTPALRQQMGAAAVTAAQAVGYVGAGTVEFLLDGEENFYFIEMNTRLQVEHPVTEMVTGLDLVAWQLAVAAGEALPLAQAEVEIKGHAVEARLYAEAPANDFLPSIGRVLLWWPPSGEGVRVDHGLRSGQAITPFYDALIAKVVAYGETRATAVRRLRRALEQTAVLGVETNRRFLLAALEHETFVAGEATTAFVAEMWQGEAAEPTARLAAVAALILYETSGEAAEPLRNWHSWPASYRFDSRGGVEVRRTAEGFAVSAAEQMFDLSVVSLSDNTLVFEEEGVCYHAVFALEEDGAVWVQLGLETGRFENRLFAPPTEGDLTGSGRVRAPMPGAVLAVAVAVGEAVVRGQTLVVLEAMKMEHAITAPFDGTVAEVAVTAGQQMRHGELLAVVEGN